MWLRDPTGRPLVLGLAMSAVGGGESGWNGGGGRGWWMEFLSMWSYETKS
jgi:hypothetical protein